MTTSLNLRLVGSVIVVPQTRRSTKARAHRAMQSSADDDYYYGGDNDYDESNSDENDNRRRKEERRDGDGVEKPDRERSVRVEPHRNASHPAAGGGGRR